ncbi:MAG: hypothetical protein DRN59_03185 [Thaumarchaeota archaeon]|nr:MAG: hypothetical protein DRN59_03185 [Nitrososphaerota archaeon]
MNKAWFVVCPRWKSRDHVNKPHGWALPQKSLLTVENRYFDPLIKCIVCGYEFSLQQGLKEAFASDNPFVARPFQYNAEESGEVEITVGQLKIVKFSKPFENAPVVYLTPQFPVRAVPGYITNTHFSILSCDGGKGVKKGKISWVVYGNRDYDKVPLWRRLISNAKRHQLEKDYRAEIIELESAFEVFISDFLRNHLTSKLREGTINWLLRRSIEEVLRIGFIEIAGKPLSEIYPEAYREWKKRVKELRDSVVHRGAFVNREQAQRARKAVFELMTKIDPKIIDHFAFQVNKI